MTRTHKLIRWAGFALATILAVALLVPSARILLYRQTDNASGLAGKRAYLTHIGGLERNPTAPNFVVILFDDLGYGDLGAYGSRTIRTPNIDRLAERGILFREAYAPSAYCTASRAGLLTGRHALRAGLDHVLAAPGSWPDTLLKLGGKNRRLPGEEITLAEVLSAAGYSTAMIGKWHLGDRSPSLPNDMGFDRFFGLLVSHDQGRPALWSDREIVEEHPIDTATLTRRFTEQAVAFVEEATDRPFFLYLAHTSPHVPLRVAPDRLGRSEAGLYGDVVEELDWSVGEIVAALERLGLASDTLVLVSSDNGPWFQGSGGEVRGRKFDLFEGGTRVPLIASLPRCAGPGRVVDGPVSLLDVFPTAIELAGLRPPTDRLIDGVSLASVLDGRDPDPERPIYFHQLAVARGIRIGRFKLHDRHAMPYGNPMNWSWSPNSYRGPWLFDLDSDPAEAYDVRARYPEVTASLQAKLASWQREIAGNPGGWLREDGDIGDR
ncbi:MAG: sulfatase [Acidobacteriota bacterium]|nr:sulfatase [Acidobacteriota bacterium]